MTTADMKYKVLSKLAEHYQQHGYSSTVDVSDVPEPVLDRLQYQRYIEIDGQGATITKRGLLAYAVAKKDRNGSLVPDVIEAVATRPVAQLATGETEPPVLTEKALSILKHLGAVGLERYRDISSFSLRVARNLENRGLLQISEDDGRACITHEGVWVLDNHVIVGTAEYQRLWQKRHKGPQLPTADISPDDIPDVTRVTTPEPDVSALDDTPEPDNGVKIGEEALTSDPRTRGNDNGSTTIPPACDTCIASRIVEIISARHPNIGKLAEKLLESEALQREIDALVEDL